MAEPVTARLWPGRLVWLALSLLLLLASLLPLSTLPPSWTGPDLLLLCTLVVIVRRPELLPVSLVAAVFFLADLLQNRPPGLWTALILLLTEVLRARGPALRALPFLIDWLAVGAGVIVVTLAYRAILWLTLVPQAPAGLVLMQMTLTLFAYPVVAMLAALLFGLTRPAPGEVDRLGRRL